MRSKIPFPEHLLGNEPPRAVSDEMNQRTLKPTLLIGLGNTGVQVFAELRSLISAHYRNIPEARDMIQYLLMDVGAPEPQLMSRIADGDYVPLNVENVSLTINTLKHGDEAFLRWWDSAYVPHKKDILEGTGGVRQLGRLALKSNLSRVKNAIVSKASDITEAESLFAISKGLQTSGALNIFVVSSACGGTGGGILIDILFLLYRLLEVEKNIKLNVYVFLLFPSAFIDKLYISFKQYRLLMANTFALFKELNYLVSKEYGKSEQFWKTSIELIDKSEGAKFAKWKPFRHCFILDNRGQESRLVPLENLFQLMSRVLFSFATLRTGKPDRGSQSIGMPPSYYNEEPFSTLGISRLVCLNNTVMKYLCSKCAIDIARDSLLIGEAWSDMRDAMKRCESTFEEADRRLSKEIDDAVSRYSLDLELNDLREKGRALVPKFVPFPNIAKIVDWAGESRKEIERQMEERLLRLEKEMSLILERLQQAMMDEITAIIDEEIEVKGISFCKEVLYKLKGLISDYSQRIIAKYGGVTERDEYFQEALTERLSLISQKKSLSTNLEEFISLMREYVDYSYQKKIVHLLQQYARGLSKSDAYHDVTERIKRAEKFLKDVISGMQGSLDDLVAFKEQDGTAHFFPYESLNRSDAIEKLYEKIYRRDLSEEMGSRFFESSKDLLTPSQIYKEPDSFMEQILIPSLYRFAFNLFSGSLGASAVSNIPALIPGGKKEFKKLMGEAIEKAEPLTLLDFDRIRQTLLWGCREQDASALRDLCPYELLEENFLYVPEGNEIFFLTVFTGFPLDSMETIRLALDHYIHLIKKNEDGLKKQNVIPFPIHIERDWHREFRLLPSLFT